ncbi:MAG: tetratricopeptide repeat protein [Bacteroidales bacterium]|nr:tetratricopeptide repeat protein [Bacteroidales bacterium]MDY4175766.1 tetratricopeptide repeat protein [Bacteroidales bacterium]
MSKQETEEKSVKATEEGFATVQQSLNKFELFFEDHQKAIGIGFIAVIVVIALGWLVKTQYLNPMQEEAQKEIFQAQYYFEADSFNLALNGDGMNCGFLKIIDEYSSTKAGKLATYYAGVCYFRLGDYDNAKKFLSQFSSDDEILSTMAIGLIGDAEVELGNDDAAIAQFKKAADKGNKVTAPIFLEKLGVMYEKQGKADEAVAAYTKLKDYPMSAQAQMADKLINSVKK